VHNNLNDVLVGIFSGFVLCLSGGHKDADNVLGGEALCSVRGCDIRADVQGAAPTLRPTRRAISHRRQVAAIAVTAAAVFTCTFCCSQLLSYARKKSMPETGTELNAGFFASCSVKV